MAALMTLDRGDRRTLQIPVTRTGVAEATSVQFAVTAGPWTASDWVTVPPDDAADNPAVYELLLAHGTVDDFPTTHPAGTITVPGQCSVWMRPPAGTDIDVQHVAWIRTRG